MSTAFTETSQEFAAGVEIVRRQFRQMNLSKAAHNVGVLIDRASTWREFAIAEGLDCVGVTLAERAEDWPEAEMLGRFRAADARLEAATNQSAVVANAVAAGEDTLW